MGSFLAPEDAEPKDYAAYARAIDSKDQAELEALSRHHCRFVRGRATAKVTSASVLWEQAHDLDPTVVANVVDNPCCPPILVETIGLWMIHSCDKWVVVWYALVVNRHTFPFVHDLLVQKMNARKKGRKKFRHERPLTCEERLILSTLRAYQENKKRKRGRKIPWGITPLGWKKYANHWSERVRKATLRHPKCPRRLQPKKKKKRTASR